MKILCFGDSNTWGLNPNSQKRFDENSRWPALLQRLLPAEFQVFEQGQPNRTVLHIPAFQGNKSGVIYLQDCLQLLLPDLVIIMLGTNDLKAKYHYSSEQICNAMAQLIQQTQHQKLTGKVTACQIILIAPTIVYAIGSYSKIYQGATAKAYQLVDGYKRLAKQFNCQYIDANQYISADKTEGVHWGSAQHSKLAEVLANRIRNMDNC